MIQSIEIKNLRGIQEGKLEGFTPLTILVGPNGSGKSTLLDALLLGASPTPGIAIRQIVSERAHMEGEVRWLIWRAQREGVGYIFLKTDQPEGVRHLIIKSEITISDSGISGNKSGSQEAIQQRIIFMPDHLDKSDNEMHFASISDQGNRFASGLFPLPGVSDIRLVETDRNNPQALLVDLFSTILDQGRREEARGILGDVLTGVTNVEIGTYNGVPRLQIVYPDRSVPLALAGDGVQSLARLSLELASRAEGVVLLEEPEVHLHPAAIGQSAKAILAAVRRNIQVIISTHSLELIDRLLNEVQDDEELAKLSLFGLKLDNGCLKSSHLEGSDISLMRTQVETDLR